MATAEEVATPALVKHGRTRSGDRVIATAELRSIDGQAPYFSVTGEIIAKGHRTPYLSGCIHDEILAVWPGLAPLVRVHLSDEKGVPMHAHANALYFMGLSAYPDALDLDKLAGHLRVTPERAAEIYAYVNGDNNPSEALHFIIKADLAPMWREQADAALALLNA